VINSILWKTAILSPDIIGIATLDERAIVIYVSPAIKSILGYDPESMVGKGCYEAVQTQVLKRERTIGADGIATRHVVAMSRCADGSEKLMDWTAREVPEHGVMITFGRELTLDTFESSYQIPHEHNWTEIRTGVWWCSGCGLMEYGVQGNLIYFPIGLSHVPGSTLRRDSKGEVVRIDGRGTDGIVGRGKERV
jgi:PAS domain S-box-containing protein